MLYLGSILDLLSLNIICGIYRHYTVYSWEMYISRAGDLFDQECLGRNIDNIIMRIWIGVYPIFNKGHTLLNIELEPYLFNNYRIMHAIKLAKSKILLNFD